MLVYEKKVENERHLYGTTSNIPSVNDSQVSFIDETGAEIQDISFTDTFVDDGKHGMIRVSDNTWAAMNVGDVNIIPGGFIPPEPVIVDFKAAPTSSPKLLYNSGELFTTQGLVLNNVYSDGTEKQMTEEEFSTVVFEPAVGTPMTTDITTFMAFYMDYYRVWPIVVI